MRLGGGLAWAIQARTAKWHVHSGHSSGTHWEQLSVPGAASPGHPPLIQNREGTVVGCCVGCESLCALYEQLEEEN